MRTSGLGIYCLALLVFFWFLFWVLFWVSGVVGMRIFVETFMYGNIKIYV